MKRITIKDISKLANVSVTTVSLVLNDKPSRISVEKIAEIKKIAKDLNYRPNLLARSLSNKRTKTIGLIIPDIENPYFSTLAKHIQLNLMKNDYMLFIANSNDLVKNDKILIKKFLDYQIDGLIYCPSNDSYKLNYEEKKLLLNLDRPIVLIDRIFEEFELNQVSFDNEYGGYIATKYLIENGKKNIACITGNLNTLNGKNRYLGYRKALKEFNIKFNQNFVFEGDYTFNSGVEIGKKVFKISQVDGIFASNDLMAQGVLTIYDKENKEIWIVGYDNLDIINKFKRSFKSVSQDLEKLSQEAVKSIFNQIKDLNFKRNIVLKPNM